MKTLPHLTLALAAALLAGLATAPRAAAYSWGGKLDELIVAERTADGMALAQPKADHPAYYVAFDGGYIEEGDPIAGEKPPAAGAVGQALRQALATQGYQEATGQAAPSLVITYHWGVLHRDTHQVRSPHKMEPNLKARINLVATKTYAERMETDIMDRRQPTLVHIPILDPREQTLLQLLGDDHYFVIVSAYDFAALTHRETKLLWHVKLSTRSAGVSMEEALPTLLQGAAPYFGQHLDDSLFLRTPLVPAAQSAAGAAFGLPPEWAGQLDQSALRGLLQDEHTRFSGVYPDQAKAVNLPAMPPPAAPSAQSYLPPALAGRITAYQQEKAALQDALAARIKAHAPGTETRQAIDAFNQENAARIAALTTEREAIRGELAKLAAANTDPAAGKSLNTLLRDFAEGMQAMN